MILIAIALAYVVHSSRSTLRERSRRFPARVVAPGPLPSVWTFLRRDCAHCRRHFAALHVALERLPRAGRFEAGRHTHIVGDASPVDPALQWHPRSLHAAMGVGPTPSTWWVDVDTSVSRIWWGPLDENTWDRLFARLLQEAHP